MICSFAFQRIAMGVTRGSRCGVHFADLPPRRPPDMPRKRLRVIGAAKARPGTECDRRGSYGQVHPRFTQDTKQSAGSSEQFFHFRTTSKRLVVPNCNSIMLVGTSRR
jgi:hypothetical protein